jgi:excisionase family DNA binding protein
VRVVSGDPIDASEVARLAAAEALRAAGGAAPVARKAYSRDEAARALGVSLTFFESQVLPELRVVRRGRRVLVPDAELDRWLSREAARAVEALR